ncbi:phosphatase PAP2 family protein [Thalassobacillus sp. CUG 92003]|uniref:phosphatase PAP2 family protein n=1 Tax=Thalassobacillus sp. CUG 92003 TaxID=2736641 RepID=UPI0015E7C867|nr:phosphatase PAP2 family protein [Thalassobacillus sp. CUG 92003]
MPKSKRFYFFLIFFLLAGLIAGLFTAKVLEQGVPDLDQASKGFAKALAGTLIFEIFRWLTELGSSTFLTVIVVLGGTYLWIKKHDPLAALMLTTGVLASYGVNYVIKQLIARERPRILEAADGDGFSFPSGHAMVSMVAYGLLVYFFIYYSTSIKRSILITASGAVLIALIGLSRYIIRVHYLTDILAGFSFGFLFLMIWILIYYQIDAHVSRSPD